MEDMRRKLSTTIAEDNYAYLSRLVKSRAAASMGDAVDHAVEIAQRLDNRARLERATAAYFANLSPKAAADEAAMEAALSAAAMEIDFDQP